MADTCYTEQLPKKFLCASALFLTLTLPLFLFQGGVNHDEVEHLAVAYRVLSGDLPYRDFHQNHLPGIWFTLLGWLAVFDGSVFPLYLGRCISISLVLLPAILSVSLLRRLTDCPNALRTLQAVFCLLILTLAPSVEAYRIRPDAWSAGLSAIGFYFLVRPGRCSYVRCMFVGILMGFAASFTFKTFPLFAVVVFALFSDIQFQALPQKISAVGVFFIGTLLGCLPLIAYLHNFDLWVEFYQQVIELNFSYARPKTIWYAFIDHVAFFAAVSAAIYIFATQKSLSVEKRKILTTAAAWILVSYGSLAIANNHAFYNFQAIIVPATVALAYFFVETISHCNKPAIQRVLCFWLVASCLWATYTDIIRKKHPHGGISLSQFSKVVALAGDGTKSCIALAPAHPIYCRNVTSLMVGWDLIFLEELTNERGLQERYRQYWQEAIEKAASGEVDLVVHKVFVDPWKAAYAVGAFSADDLEALTQQSTQYEQWRIGRTDAITFWVKRVPESDEQSQQGQ